MNTLEILDWDHAFTQQNLLAEYDFVKFCVARGLDLTRSHLEALHRRGLVVPLYSIRYVAAELVRRARVDGDTADSRSIQVALHGVNTEREGLIAERRVGDLADSQVDPYRSWSQRGSFRGRPYAKRRYLYSPYQVLGLRELVQSITSDQLTSEERRGRAVRRSVLANLRETGQAQRRRATLLSLMEAAYLPDVQPRLRGFRLDVAAWSKYRAAFDPAAAVRAAGFEVDDLSSLAASLLSTARAFDPLARWSDLVGLVHHAKREQLGGLARLAMDHRVAAEMLLLAHEDLEHQGVVEPLRVEHRMRTPLDYRLGVSRHRLQRTLTEFGLSPHPSVLLVLEGKVDRLAITGFLDERLRQGWRNAIQVIDAEGVDKNISAIATMVAPLAGEIDGDVVILDRPPTRVLIVVDPEGRMSTPEGRFSARRRWIDRFHNALPEEFQVPAARADLEGLVTIETWDAAGNAFEFAHFSDPQIARAILATAIGPVRPSMRMIVRRVASAREERRNLKSVWSDFGAPRPTKVRIFHALEGEFRAAVHRSIDARDDPPTYPAARIIVTALRLAGGSHRNTQTVLRLKV